MSRKKQFLALVLSLTVILSMMPFSVFADDAAGGADQAKAEVKTEQQDKDAGASGSKAEKKETAKEAADPAPEKSAEKTDKKDDASSEKADASDKSAADKDAAAKGADADKADASDKTDAEAGKSSEADGTGSTEAAGTAGSTETAEAADPEADAEEADDVKMPALSFTETTKQGVKVTVRAGKGTFAEGTTVKIKDAKKSEAIRAASDLVDKDSIVDAVAVDITFYDKDGKETEPAKGHSVDVTITPAEEIEGANHTVIHVLDNGSAEKVKDKDVEKVNGDTASFEADSFTIYAVIGTENEMPPTLTYYFYDADGKLLSDDTQMVKEGDTLYEPEVLNPSGTTDSFQGWYEKGAENPFTGFGVVGPVAADAEVHLYAKFSDKVAVFYKDLSGRIAYTQEGAPGETITVQADFPAINTGSLTSKQAGWALTEGSTEDVSGDFKLGTKNVYLYPIIVDGYWVTFESNGGTAYNAQFIELDADPGTATDPGTPIKDGYVFTKWYADEACTQEYDFSAKVTQNITIYAGYEPGEAPYMVRYWVEYQTSKDPERTASYNEATKTWTYSTETAGTWDYKMVAQKAATGITGTDTVYDNTLIFNPPYNQQDAALELNTEKTVVKQIAADGSTIMDVYYDTKEFSLTFNFPSTYASRIVNDTHVTDTVKYGANIDYMWDTIYSYNKDGYEVLSPGRRFVFSYSDVKIAASILHLSSRLIRSGI